MAVIRIKDIYEPGQGALATRAVAQPLDRPGPRVFTKQDLRHLIAKHREQWHILDRVPPNKIIDYLLTVFPLRKIVLDGPDHSQEFNRYLWREAHPLELAASVRAPSSYLCHSSALFMHGLVDGLPKDLCINYEQSEKPKPPGGLTQESIDRAFQGKQRQSAFIFHYATHRIVVPSGKHTRSLEVRELAIDTGAKVRVTDIERTLIDITVRPTYAGGVEHVLEAFRWARHKVCIPKLIATLQKIDHVYPYHQAIGFYLERAGYSPGHLTEFKKATKKFDFYLAHGMRDPAYSDQWRIFHPPGM
jgi:hypothetical protein